MEVVRTIGNNAMVYGGPVIIIGTVVYSFEEMFRRWVTSNKWSFISVTTLALSGLFFVFAPSGIKNMLSFS